MVTGWPDKDKVHKTTYESQYFKRSAGRSATAATAYRSTSVIECDREGRMHDYTAKRGVEA